MIRLISELSFPEPLDEIDKLSLIYNFPRWMIESLSKVLDLDSVEKFLRSLNKRLPT